MPRNASQDSPGTRTAMLREVRRLVRDFTLLLVVLVVAVVFLFQPFKVEGTSMEPRLAQNERILVNRFVYRMHPIARGDVVVFWYPGDPARSFVKRIIGLPGEEVLIRGGTVHVNGRPIAEPYLPPEFRSREEFGPIRVSPGYYFVLGDHRTVSNDSRAWGMVPAEAIYGKAFLRYWPVGRFGAVD